MNGINVSVIIPFRDRGTDPHRAANLDIVQAWWYMHGFDPCIVDDGLTGNAQFNRHRAYNRAVAERPDTEVFVFTEADMLIHPEQIRLAIRLANWQPGLVVPFTQYRYLSEVGTYSIRDAYHDLPPEMVADWWGRGAQERDSLWDFPVESTMDNGRSIGAVNVLSAETLRRTGGFTESTDGNWFDDRIIEEGFAYLTGVKTRHVPGPAVHMYHLPGHKGSHLTCADKAATERNKNILRTMRRDIRLRRDDRVRALMSVRKPAPSTTEMKESER